MLPGTSRKNTPATLSIKKRRQDKSLFNRQGEGQSGKLCECRDKELDGA